MSQMKTCTSFTVDSILSKKEPRSATSPLSGQSTDSPLAEVSRFQFDKRLVAMMSPSTFSHPFLSVPAGMHGSVATSLQPNALCGLPAALSITAAARSLPSFSIPSPAPPLTIVHRHSSTNESPLSSPDVHGTDLPKKRKKKRTAFSTPQLKRLEDRFKEQKYLSKIDRCELASQLGLSERHVKTWYQNRRTKWKKECCESDWSRQREQAATVMYMQHLSRTRSAGNLDDDEDSDCSSSQE